MTLSPNVQGALWMCASMAGFVLNDVLMKTVATDVPLFQAILIRGLFATAVISAVAYHRGALRYRPERTDRKLIGMRMLAEIGATSLFLTALFNMPIANATAILQITPLAITLTAAVVLKERVGWRRTSAIAVGFLGMLLIVGPGGGELNVYALVAVASVIFIVMRDMVTRRLSSAVPSLLVTVATALSITAFAGLMTIVRGWEDISAAHVAMLGTAALFLLVGYYGGIQTMRTGEVSFVAPFRYTNLLWALFLGAVVFQELPSMIALLGAALITGAGLYALRRENLPRRQG